MYLRRLFADYLLCCSLFFPSLLIPSLQVQNSRLYFFLRMQLILIYCLRPCYLALLAIRFP